MNIMCYITHLGIFPSKTMSIQVKRVATRLGPASVIITFPCHRCESAQMAPIPSRYQVIGQNAVEFSHSPPSILFGWNPKLYLHGFGKKLCQL